jgi:hypothetical protein
MLSDSLLRRRQVVFACLSCVAKKRKCDEFRPCQRCIKHNCECIDKPENVAAVAAQTGQDDISGVYLEQSWVGVHGFCLNRLINMDWLDANLALYRALCAKRCDSLVVVGRMRGFTYNHSYVFRR